nr:SGNH/GDSL hydrolase family protein [Pontibacter sp. KCTC 32443]
MCLGNSITQADNEHTSYRFPLWKKLVDAGIDVEFVGSHATNFGGLSPAQGTVYKGKTFTNRNEGHWGWRADEILYGKDGNTNNKLQSWLTAYTPDIALIHLGTNDIFQGHSIVSTIDEIDLVIQLIREKNPNVTILLAQLIPSNLSHDNINQRLITLNSEIAILAEELNTLASPVILVDQHTDFDAAQYTYDDVHPNEQGEEAMAQCWFDALNTVLKPLPVSFLSFKASYTHHNKVQLTWTTASERNNLYFEVQRAQDSTHFSTIATVTGAGTTQTKSTYSYLDITAPSGELYYRLKQVDKNGSSTYSGIIHISKSPKKHKLSIYPTITHNEHISLHLQQQPHTSVELAVYGANGTLVQRIKGQSNASGDFKRTIITTELQGKGLYIVKSASGSQVLGKFIVEQ